MDDATIYYIHESFHVYGREHPKRSRRFNQFCCDACFEVILYEFPKLLTESRISDGDFRYDVTDTCCCRPYALIIFIIY